VHHHLPFAPSPRPGRRDHYNYGSHHHFNLDYHYFDHDDFYDHHFDYGAAGYRYDDDDYSGPPSS